MRRQTIFLLMTTILISCSQWNIRYFRLPDSIHSFINEHFPRIPSEVKKNVATEDYTIVMDEGTVLIFTQYGEWREILLGASTDMPRSIYRIDSLYIVKRRVDELYPDSNIRSIIRLVDSAIVNHITQKPLIFITTEIITNRGYHTSLSVQFNSNYFIRDEHIFYDDLFSDIKF